MSAVASLFRNDYDAEGFRTCSVTGLDIHRSVENYVKLFGLTAVIALAVGGSFAFSVAMTRWEFIGLLDPSSYYTHLSIHAWNLLIFWMVLFMEIAVLYVGGPMVLGRALPLRRLATVGWGTMVAGAIGVNASIWLSEAPNEAPLLTAYVPLPVTPWFYGAAIVFLLGATIASLPFFATIWSETRDSRRTLPTRRLRCVRHRDHRRGGDIRRHRRIRVRARLANRPDRLRGSGNLPPALLDRRPRDPADQPARDDHGVVLPHPRRGGAVVISEKVSRTAFILYLFFINLGAAHHLLVDPGMSAGWRIWNTSYAFYGAAFASMIHAFAIPAGIEAGRRRRGQGGGLFGWLTSAPWRNPSSSPRSSASSFSASSAASPAS